MRRGMSRLDKLGIGVIGENFWADYENNLQGLVSKLLKSTFNRFRLVLVPENTINGKSSSIDQWRRVYRDIFSIRVELAITDYPQDVYLVIIQSGTTSSPTLEGWNRIQSFSCLFSWLSINPELDVLSSLALQNRVFECKFPVLIGMGACSADIVSEIQWENIGLVQVQVPDFQTQFDWKSCKARESLRRVRFWFVTLISWASSRLLRCRYIQAAVSQ